jgi:alkylated DNA nucleotide flippase Atl1
MEEQDLIVDIPPNRVRYFGGTGKMLLPGPATIRALIQNVPTKQVITTELIRKKLTAQFHVQGTCPVTTLKALKAMANDASSGAPYWRVIKKNGNLMSTFPGGVKGQAALLRKEGIGIDTRAKTPRVRNFEERLATLG